MNAISTTDVSFLQSLPADIRQNAFDWAEALAGVRKPIGKSLAALAMRFNLSTKQARRKYDDYKKHGLKGLVNCSRAAISRAALLSGSGQECPRSAMAKNSEFVAYAKMLAENNQRKTAPAWRKFCKAWHRGEMIPGLDNALPRHELPAGCGYDNFLRLVNDAFAQEATRHGLSSARGKYGPMNFTTRANLWYGSHYPIDDVWHDNFVVFGHERSSQVVRVLQLGGMDVFSGAYIAWGCKPRVAREDGTMDGLKEKYARLIVCKILFLEGYSPRGTEFLAEHGTAAVSEFLEKIMRRYAGLLPGTDKATVSVRRAGITGEEQAVLGWTGQGKGNPRHKSWLECFHALVHNELAALPAQAGMDRDALPEYTNAMLSADTETLKCMAVLAQKDPVAAARMKLRLPHYHADFLPLLMDVYRELNDRHWHELEGWDKIPGNRIVEYRTAPASDHWLSDADFSLLPPESQNLIVSLAKADPRYLQSRRLSPSEVRRRELTRSPLIKFPAFVIAEMLGPDFGRELEVKGAYFRPFSDEELSPEPMRYESVVVNAEGREEQLKDDKYWTLINPFDTSVIFVHDAARRFLGTARIAGRADLADAEQIKAGMGRVAHRMAEMKKPILARHATEVKAETSRRAHNAGIIEDIEGITEARAQSKKLRGFEGSAEELLDDDAGSARASRSADDAPSSAPGAPAPGEQFSAEGLL
jgi:hypothetical protein